MSRILWPAETRSLAWVRDQVRQVAPGLEHWGLDATYRIPTLEDFLGLLRWDPTDQAEYAVDALDCEDFAFQLVATMRWRLGLNSVGWVADNQYRDAMTGFVYPHSYCLCLFTDAPPQVLEPQTDQLWRPGEQGYGMREGLCLL